MSSEVVRDHYMTEEHAQTFNQLRRMADKAADAVIELDAVVINSEPTLTSDEVLRVLSITNDIGAQLRSLAYMLSPQSEWTGGDSLDSKNFKYRYPHICKS